MNITWHKNLITSPNRKQFIFCKRPLKIDEQIERSSVQPSRQRKIYNRKTSIRKEIFCHKIRHKKVWKFIETTTTKQGFQLLISRMNKLQFFTIWYRRQWSMYSVLKGKIYMMDIHPELGRWIRSYGTVVVDQNSFKRDMWSSKWGIQLLLLPWTCH